jgi:hypothetical protein
MPKSISFTDPQTTLTSNHQKKKQRPLTFN